MKSRRKASIHLPNTYSSRTPEPAEPVEQPSPHYFPASNQFDSAIEAQQEAENSNPTALNRKQSTSRHHKDVLYVRLPSIS